MKIVTPDYYKNFKCIAGECTDTCCAGWDVDVDKESYKQYRRVIGSFGNKLRSVMVPSEDGGCTFTLKEGRCPFLNKKNLCEIYIKLGKDSLCETCAEFPRFINEYGNTREIGIAPSCKTAGELILGYKGELKFREVKNREQINSYKDIDTLTFVQLRQARIIAYNIATDRDYTIMERCVLILMFARNIQDYLDRERDELIVGVCGRFAKEDYRENKLNRARRIAAGKKDTYKYIRKFFESFEGMEVINKDWNIYTEEVNNFFEECTSAEQFRAVVQEFDEYHKEDETEYEQLLMYYLYRYFLDSVYDYNLLLKVKGGIVGIIAIKMLNIADWWYNNKELSFTRKVDLAHLYSRQYVHSYYNYEVYNQYFMSKRAYAYENLLSELIDLE